MSWIKQTIRNWLSDANNANMKLTGSTIGGSAPFDSRPSMNFAVYNAIGGKVIEFRRYDSKREHVDHTMYVIDNDQDFGEKIAKIAMLEQLKD